MQIKNLSIYFYFIYSLLLVSTKTYAANWLYENDTIKNSGFCLSAADSLILEANKYMGVKYKYGGMTEKGFDCSGFTKHIYSSINIHLPRSSYDQSQMGVNVDLSQCRKGDLIFFKGRNLRIKKIGHVGIISNVNDGVIEFIHASSHRGIVLSDLSESYYKQRFIQIKRILNDSLFSYTRPDSDSASLALDTSSNIIYIKQLNDFETKNEAFMKEHIVKRGETLYSISKTYAIEVHQLKKWNYLKSNIILPGQRLDLFPKLSN
jgi:LysM repeat protein